jgi:hypothetical protein
VRQCGVGAIARLKRRPEGIGGQQVQHGGVDVVRRASKVGRPGSWCRGVGTAGRWGHLKEW